MVASGGGTIVNMASVAGLRAMTNLGAYVTGKAGIIALTETAALDYADRGVRVNAVAPGPIDTAMLDRFTGSADRKAGLVAGVPLKRTGRPEEIADAILFLASGRASFVTGQIVDVNGGKTAS